jgi:hypothetical protein
VTKLTIKIAIGVAVVMISVGCGSEGEIKLNNAHTALPISQATPSTVPTELPSPTSTPVLAAMPMQIPTLVPTSTPMPEPVPTLIPTPVSIPTPRPTVIPKPTPHVVSRPTPKPDPCRYVPEPHKARCEDSLFLEDFDLGSIAQVARFNFSELEKFSRMSKLRSGVGHDYSFNTDEHDPTGSSCRSMKHYFLPVGTPLKNELYDKTSHSFEWMSIKFFAPADGVIQDLGDDHQFVVESTHFPGYYFKFHHVHLSSGLRHGSTVVAGQQIGTLAEEDAWGEIGVEVRVNSRKVYLLSFLQVATDQVLDLYRMRGLTDVADVVITKEERDAVPLRCNKSSAAGWFEGGGNYKPDEQFMIWQYESSDNWFFFD